MISAVERRTQISVDVWIRLAIIGGVLLAAAFMGGRASIEQLALLVAAGGALLLLRMPQLGLVGLIVAALSVPFAIGTGTQTPIHAVVLLIPALLVIWLGNMLVRRDLQFVRSPVNLPLAAFVISVTISYIGGNLPWNIFAGHANQTAQTGGLMIYLLSAGVFLLMANQLKDLRWLQVLTWLFLALGVLDTAGQLIPALSLISNAVLVRTIDAGSLYWVWLAALAGGQAVFNTALPKKLRFGLVAFIVVTIARAWLVDRIWVSGWLPPSVVVLALIWLRNRRLGLIVTLIAVAYFVLLKPDIAGEVAELKQYSTDTRLIAWQIILTQVVPANPIIGLGPANYYFYTPLYPILGYYVSFNSHNQYVDIIAQTGVVGMAVFIWLMAAIGKVGWDLRERVQEGFAKGYVNGALAGLAGSLYASAHGDWFIPFVYNIGLSGFRASMLGWLFLGAMIAVGKIAHRNPSNQSAGRME